LNTISASQSYYFVSQSSKFIYSFIMRGETQPFTGTNPENVNMYLFRDMAVSPDGRFVATVGRDSLLSIYEIKNYIHPRYQYKMLHRSQQLLFSRDGNILVVISVGRKIMDDIIGIIYGQMDQMVEYSVYSMLTGKSVTQMRCIAAQPNVSAFSRDGRLFAITTNGNKAIDMLLGKRNSLEIWDLQKGSLVSSMSKMGYMITSLDFSPDGKTLVASSFDGKIRCWGVAAGKRSERVIRLKDAALWAKYSPDGSKIITATGKGHSKANILGLFSIFNPGLPPGGHAAVLDAKTGKGNYNPLKHPSWVTKVNFNNDGTKAISGSSDGCILIWDAGTGRLLTDSLNLPGWIFSVCFSPDGSKALASSSQGYVMIWDSKTGRPVSDTLRHQGSVVSAFFTPDGESVVSITDEGLVSIYNADDGAQVYKHRWDDARLWYHRGMEKYLRDQYSRALVDFVKCLECNPNHAEAKKFTAIVKKILNSSNTYSH
ncbi:MAG: hypothetical protein QME74_06915, partial [Candidatus Edwardsbacteria bacterium]|nr:hypothetical protein [Candidatus Edwardsbacteria bacterium]